MAEFIFKKMAADDGAAGEFFVASAATSTEEIGNGMHPGARAKLERMGVPFGAHRARRIRENDYGEYDFLIGMDVENLYYMEKMWRGDPQNKVKLLLSYAGKDRDIADPWYTHNFDDTYDDIAEGCAALLAAVRGNARR